MPPCHHTCAPVRSSACPAVAATVRSHCTGRNLRNLIQWRSATYCCLHPLEPYATDLSEHGGADDAADSHYSLVIVGDHVRVADDHDIQKEDCQRKCSVTCSDSLKGLLSFY